MNVFTETSTDNDVQHSIKKPVVITTIGSIRDYPQNRQVMMALANRPDYIVKFIGKPGPAGTMLQKYARMHKVTNVEFTGFYDKKDEVSLIADADFLNIYYPDIFTHATALSNRFYNALIHKKPMIVTKSSIQGDFVEKYNLGLAINNCSNLAEDIQNFIKKFNYSEFIKNCDHLMTVFLEDYHQFRKHFLSFLRKIWTINF